MPRLARFEHAVPVDLTVLAPHGVARTADLVATGISPAAIQRRCLSGRWKRVGLGLVRVGPGRSDDDQLLHTALAHGGESSVITGAHALRRHDLTRTTVDGRIRVLIPADRRRRSTELTVVERTGRLPEGVLRGGVRVAPVERAVLDTARTRDTRDSVRSVIAEAVQRRRTTIARLVQELADGSQRGTALPRSVLREVECGIRSVAEGWAFDVHHRSDLPPILWNRRLLTASGRFLASPDGFFDDVAMAWEIDSKEFHLTSEEWEATLRRRADMTNAQVVVAHHPPAFVLEQPRRVVADLWGAYRLAASRPRPEVFAR